MTPEKYEWVFGPVASQPSQRSRVKEIDGEWIFEPYGPFQCAIYGQVRRIRDGLVLNWAKMSSPETAEQRRAELGALHPLAKDWSKELRRDVASDTTTGEGDFETGIIVRTNQGQARPDF